MKRERISSLARSPAGRRDPYWGGVVLDSLRALEALERASDAVSKTGVTNPRLLEGLRNATAWARENVNRLAAAG